MSPLLPIAFFLASVVAHPPPVPVLQNIVEAQAPIAFTPVLADGIRVPVLLGVMSRCPDALLCESIFDSVLKQTWDIVDISLSFVGKINDSDSDFGVTCKHGVDECRGNVQELCAMTHANSQQDWWSFVQCLNFEGADDIGSPGLAERCAGLTYIPWNDETTGNTTHKGIKSCVDSEEGKNLLKTSVTQSQSLGIEKSCTIMISGQARCIHDGTWKECETGHSVEEIIGYIQDEYQKLNSQKPSLQEN